MIGEDVRKPALSIMVLLVFAALELAAQPPRSVASADKDYLPAGPFLFEPGTIQPKFMDAFNDRPAVQSPDGKLEVTVTAPKKSYAAWLTISFSAFPDRSIQVWPIQASVAALWRPDSKAFALTDNRYANRSFVLVCGTDFRMGEEGEGLGVPITDLTPIVEKAFQEPARIYYETDNYETRLFYSKVLRWIGNTDLLVGVSATTVGSASLPDRGMKEWDLAYLVDVPDGKVVRELDREKLLSEYKIKLPQ